MARRSPHTNLNTMKSSHAHCPACLSIEAFRSYTSTLPRSMRSDGVVIEEPLVKFLCDNCGLAIGANKRSDDAYARSDGTSTYELDRHRAVAAGVKKIIDLNSSSINGRLLEIGAASFRTTDLLSALLDGWEIIGIDSSPEIRHDTNNKFTRVVGDYATYPFDLGFDVVFSNNVIEHIEELRHFLDKMRHDLVVDGVVIACTPSYTSINHELLFTDHLWHFTPQAMDVLCSQVNLRVVAQYVSDWDSRTHVYIMERCSEVRGSIRTQSAGTDSSDSYTLEKRTSTVCEPPISRMPRAVDLNSKRRAYLATWESKQSEILQQLVPGRTLVMFGAGEYAQIVRTLLPDVYKEVKIIVVDSIAGCRNFTGPELLALSEYHERDVNVLVAVSPLNALIVKKNLIDAGFRAESILLLET